jgi:hypothetical protein
MEVVSGKIIKLRIEDNISPKLRGAFARQASRVTSEDKDNIKRLTRELFLVLSLKSRLYLKIDKNSNETYSLDDQLQIIRKELRKLNTTFNIKLNKKIEDIIIDHTLERLSKFTAISKSEKRGCCCFAFISTCNKRSAYPRLKLIGSTVLAYFDIVSDIFVTIAIYGLIGTVKSRQFCELLLYDFYINHFLSNKTNPTNILVKPIQGYFWQCSIS